VLAGPVAADDDSLQNVVERYSARVSFGSFGSFGSRGSRGSRGRGRTTLLQNPRTGGFQFSKSLDNIGTKSIPDYGAYADSFEYGVRLPGGHMARMFVGQRKDPFVVALGETFDLVNLDPLGEVDGAEDDLADKNVTAFVLEVPIAFLTSGGEDVIGAWTTARLDGRGHDEGSGRNSEQV